MILFGNAILAQRKDHRRLNLVIMPSYSEGRLGEDRWRANVCLLMLRPHLALSGVGCYEVARLERLAHASGNPGSRLASDCRTLKMTENQEMVSRILVSKWVKGCDCLVQINEL